MVLRVLSCGYGGWLGLVTQPCMSYISFFYMHEFLYQTISSEYQKHRVVDKIKV